jgi:hypothetical protein
MNVLLVPRACRCEVYTFRRLERHACCWEGTALTRGTSEISVLDTPFPCSLRHPNTLATAAWVNVGIFGCRPFVSTKGTALRRAIHAIHGCIQRPLHAAPMLAGMSASAGLCLRSGARSGKLELCASSPAVHQGGPDIAWTRGGSNTRLLRHDSAAHS